MNTIGKIYQKYVAPVLVATFLTGSAYAKPTIKDAHYTLNQDGKTANVSLYVEPSSPSNPVTYVDIVNGDKKSKSFGNTIKASALKKTIKGRSVTLSVDPAKMQGVKRAVANAYATDGKSESGAPFAITQQKAATKEEVIDMSKVEPTSNTYTASKIPAVKATPVVEAKSNTTSSFAYEMEDRLQAGYAMGGMSSKPIEGSGAFPFSSSSTNSGFSFTGNVRPKITIAKNLSVILDGNLGMAPNQTITVDGEKQTSNLTVWDAAGGIEIKLGDWSPYVIGGYNSQKFTGTAPSVGSFDQNGSGIKIEAGVDHNKDLRLAFQYLGRNGDGHVLGTSYPVSEQELNLLARIKLGEVELRPSIGNFQGEGSNLMTYTVSANKDFFKWVNAELGASYSTGTNADLHAQNSGYNFFVNLGVSNVFDKLTEPKKDEKKPEQKQAPQKDVKKDTKKKSN